MRNKSEELIRTKPWGIRGEIVLGEHFSDTFSTELKPKCMRLRGAMDSMEVWFKPGLEGPGFIEEACSWALLGNGIPFGETLNKLRDGGDLRFMSHSNNKGGEHLIDVLMCVAHREERHGNGLEHLVGDQPMTVGKHVLIFVLTATVVKLKVECTGLMCIGCSEYLTQV